MTKGQIVAEILKSHFGLPRKEIIPMIIEKAGCTPSSASGYYYYFSKELGLVKPKLPKEKKVKAAKAPRKPRVKKTAVLTVEPPRPYQAQAQAFLKWRSQQEVEQFEEPQEIEFFEFDHSETEEARELLRVIAE